MVEITKDNEPIYVQLGSHSERLAAKDSAPVVLSSGVICDVSNNKLISVLQKFPNYPRPTEPS